MARALIGPKAKVIVSSEWDFSPLTYPLTVTVLPDYVLIGMPSSESSNSLILPLAGHELGHSVWQNEQLEDRYASEVEGRARQDLKDKWLAFQAASPQHANLRPTDEQFATNSILVDVLSKIVRLSLSQIEESFCDAVGVYLFGESYAFAFHYLLAPSLGGTRSLEYPRLADRAQNLATYGNLDLKSLGFSDYAGEFQDRQPALAAPDAFISGSADSIAQQMSEAVYRCAHQIVRSKAAQFAPDANSHDDILRMFNHGIPAKTPRAMSDILNAGWAYVTRNRGSFDESERSLTDWISELILKSVEVLEYRTRLNHA